VTTQSSSQSSSPAVRLRFRQSFATVTAVLVMAVGAFSIAGQEWAYTPLMLVPLAALWWAVRTGVDVDGDGITVRRALGSQTFGWADVEGFSSARGRVSLHLTAAAGGKRLRLPAVTPATLPRLIASVSPTPPTPVEPAPAAATPGQATTTSAETLTEA
jgi:hypothetical protein